MAMFAGTPFNLTCAAIGPPEPVEVLWWLGGVQEGEPRPSPSILYVPGQRKMTSRCIMGKVLKYQPACGRSYSVPFKFRNVITEMIKHTHLFDK